MIKLIKVSAHDCEICKQLAYHDVSIAEDEQMAMEVVELGNLAKDEGSNLYNYVVNYHLAGDGSITVPIYVIINGEDIQGSGEVKDHDELRNLVEAWKTWKATQPES
jgi:type VI protein secretion system component Hcp